MSKERKLVMVVIVLAAVCSCLVYVLITRPSSESSSQEPNGSTQEVDLDNPKEMVEALHKYKDDYLSISEDAAVAKAKADGLVSRVVARDVEQIAVTDDLRYDRVNFTVMNGMVTRVEFY